MLPRNRLANRQITKLKVYAGPDHPHEAQDPTTPARVMSQLAQYQGTGKRKTSVARVILRPGDGQTWINGRTLEEYFPRQVLRTVATMPLRTAGVEGTLRHQGATPRGRAGGTGGRTSPRDRPRSRSRPIPSFAPS